MFTAAFAALAALLKPRALMMAAPVSYTHLFGGDGLGNAFEFAHLVEGVDEIAEGIKSHTRAKLTEKTSAGNAEKNQTTYLNLNTLKIRYWNPALPTKPTRTTRKMYASVLQIHVFFVK